MLLPLHQNNLQFPLQQRLWIQIIVEKVERDNSTREEIIVYEWEKYFECVRNSELGWETIFTLSTTHSQISNNDSALAPAYIYVRNLSDYHNVQIGLEISSTFVPMFELGPRRETIFPFNDENTLYAKSLSGTPDIHLRSWNK